MQDSPRATRPFAALAAVALAVAVFVVAAAAAPAGPPEVAPPTEPPPGAAPPADEERRLAEGMGWYTEDQAEEGREAYLRHCAECHSPDLKARSAYISLYRFPALTGEYFWDRWRGQNLHALQLVIQHTMPLDAPNSLSGETYAAITAHVLQVNGFPPGARELPPAGDAPDALVGRIIDPAATERQARAQIVGLRPDAGPVEEPDTAVPPEEQEQPAAEIDAEPEDPPGDVAPGAPDFPGAAEDPDEPEEEVPDAWYAASQAERAVDVFREHCARCHGGNLQGIGVAPPLSGDNFRLRWEGRSVAAMLEIIVDAMPLDGPELVGAGAAADLVALILEHNGFPAGPVELPADADRLERFVIHRALAGGAPDDREDPGGGAPGGGAPGGGAPGDDDAPGDEAPDDPEEDDA